MLYIVVSITCMRADLRTRNWGDVICVYTGMVLQIMSTDTDTDTDQLYSSLNDNMLHPAQSGFRPGYLTVSCTLSFLNHVYI